MSLWRIIQKIKIGFSIKRVLNKIEEVRKMKEKEKRTELWVILGVEIVTLILAIQRLLPVEVGIKIMAILAGIYAVLRTVLKIIKILAPLTKTDIDNQIAEIVEKVIERTENKIKEEVD